MIGFLVALALSGDPFDLKGGIVGEWELFGPASSVSPAYTVEFHAGGRPHPLIGSFWLNSPDGTTLNDSLSTIFEVVFSSAASGDLYLLSPAQSRFATFNCRAYDEPGRLAEVSGADRDGNAYVAEFESMTAGVLKVDGALLFEFRRVPTWQSKTAWSFGGLPAYAVMIAVALAYAWVNFKVFGMRRPRREARPSAREGADARAKDEKE